MMTRRGFLNKVGREITELSKHYFNQGNENYQQNVLDTIASKYNSYTVHRSFSEAYVIFSDSYIHCAWLTGGWLFREDREGDVKIRIAYEATPALINKLKEDNKEEQLISFVNPTFYGVRNAEKNIIQRTATFQRWYNGIIKKFVRLLFEKTPDTNAIRKIMEQMSKGVQPSMNKAQAAAVLLKAVIEELRVRSSATVSDTDPIYLVSEIGFLVSTEFMEHTKKIAYFENCYNQLLFAASLFFWEGASYAQWKAVVNQVFEVGSGRKVEDAEKEIDIFLRRLLGYFASTSEEQVALDLLLKMLQTLDEIRHGKHYEDIEKVRARLNKHEVGDE